MAREKEIETLRCNQCGSTFERERVRGRKPKVGPCCRHVPYANDPGVDYVRQRVAELAQKQQTERGLPEDHIDRVRAAAHKYRRRDST